VARNSPSFVQFLELPMEVFELWRKYENLMDKQRRDKRKEKPLKRNSWAETEDKEEEQELKDFFCDHMNRCENFLTTELEDPRKERIAYQQGVKDIIDMKNYVITEEDFDPVMAHTLQTEESDWHQESPGERTF